VPISVVNRSAEAMRRYEDAAYKGMDAAANHLRVEVQKAFGSWYYKGGAFRSTLQVKQAIRRTPPMRTPTGFEARVGIKGGEVGMVALYWELGHRNTFTRRYERVEIWVPTAVKETPAMQTTFARVVARFMNRS
jgi:hypothetical protein